MKKKLNWDKILVRYHRVADKDSGIAKMLDIIILKNHSFTRKLTKKKKNPIVKRQSPSTPTSQKSPFCWQMCTQSSYCGFKSSKHLMS
jgi:hypothetical protein